MPRRPDWSDGDLAVLETPPGYLGPQGDPDSFLFTGADPCWTPARERHHGLAVPDPATGKPIPGSTTRPVPGSPVGRTATPETCPECGGRLARDSGHDPLGDSELVVKVCARCFRCEGKHAGRLTGDISDPDLDRPGRMASKITGKGDPSLNAYLKPIESTDSIIRDTQPNGPARKRPAGKPDKPAATGKPGGADKLMTGRGAHRGIGEYL